VADRVFNATVKVSFKDFGLLYFKYRWFYRLALLLPGLLVIFLMFTLGYELWIYFLMLVPIMYVVIFVAFIRYQSDFGVSYTMKKDKLVIDRFGESKSINYSEIRKVNEVPYIPQTAKQSAWNGNEIEIKFVDKVGAESSVVVCPNERKEFLSMLRERIAQTERLSGEEIPSTENRQSKPVSPQESGSNDAWAYLLVAVILIAILAYYSFFKT